MFGGGLGLGFGVLGFGVRGLGLSVWGSLASRFMVEGIGGGAV